MVMKAVRLIGIGVAVGVLVDRIALEQRKPPATRYRTLRELVNERVNPWLLEHEIPGSERAEIGTLEHLGRTTGRLHRSPVYPTVRGEVVLIPAPMGMGSQCARNVLHAGHARLSLHETLFELDRPELIAAADTGFYPRPLAAVVDALGWRYVRLHVRASTRATFVPLRATPTSGTEEPSLTAPYEIPVEPGMVRHEPLVEAGREPDAQETIAVPVEAAPA